MISLAICDDIIQDRDRISRAVGAAFPDMDIRAYQDGGSLLADLGKGFQPAIAVLDIQMKDLGGIALAKELHQRLPLCRIIFATDYLHYAPDVYEVPHCYFVLKSQMDQRIGPALQRAREELTQLPQLCFRAKGQLRLLKAEQVLYLERRSRKTYLYCSDNTYETTDHGREILQRSGTQQFCQCHKSFWVNLQYITAMEKTYFLLENGTQVPISRNYRKAVKGRFLTFLRQELDG